MPSKPLWVVFGQNLEAPHIDRKDTYSGVGLPNIDFKFLSTLFAGDIYIFSNSPGGPGRKVGNFRCDVPSQISSRLLRFVSVSLKLGQAPSKIDIVIRGGKCERGVIAKGSEKMQARWMKRVFGNVGVYMQIHLLWKKRPVSVLYIQAVIGHIERNQEPKSHGRISSVG